MPFRPRCRRADKGERTPLGIVAAPIIYDRSRGLARASLIAFPGSSSSCSPFPRPLRRPRGPLCVRAGRRERGRAPRGDNCRSPVGAESELFALFHARSVSELVGGGFSDAGRGGALIVPIVRRRFRRIFGSGARGGFVALCRVVPGGHVVDRSSIDSLWAV